MEKSIVHVVGTMRRHGCSDGQIRYVLRTRYLLKDHEINQYLEKDTHATNSQDGTADVGCVSANPAMEPEEFAAELKHAAVRQSVTAMRQNGYTTEQIMSLLENTWQMSQEEAEAAVQDDPNA